MKRMLAISPFNLNLLIDRYVMVKGSTNHSDELRLAEPLLVQDLTPIRTQRSPDMTIVALEVNANQTISVLSCHSCS
jgi:hypothetical protein